MLLGEGLAEDFGVSVGDYLTILTRTRYGTYQALDLRIKGILRTEDPKIDWSAVVIPLGLGQKALDLEEAVTEINIKLKNPNEIAKFKDKLAKELIGVEVAPYQDLAEDVMAIAEAKYKSRSFLFASIFLIALVGITNTVLLAVFERIKEIGTMAAMGMKRGQVIKLFVLEGAAIGFLGSLVGGFLGSLLVFTWLVPIGIDYSFLPLKELGEFGYRVTAKFYGEFRAETVLMVFFVGIIASAVASFYPAWLASRMEPTEALRKG